MSEARELEVGQVRMAGTVALLCGTVVFVASVLVGWVAENPVGSVVLRALVSGLVMSVVAFLLSTLGLLVLHENQPRPGEGQTGEEAPLKDAPPSNTATGGDSLVEETVEKTTVEPPVPRRPEKSGAGPPLATASVAGRTPSESTEN